MVSIFSNLIRNNCLLLKEDIKGVMKFGLLSRSFSVIWLTATYSSSKDIFYAISQWIQFLDLQVMDFG